MTPAGLPAMTMGLRGSIVHCAPDTPYTESDVAAKLAAKNVVGVVPTSGTTFYRIAYRTYRDDGVPGVSTAGVYLPTAPTSSTLPVVAIGHPTEGLAPSVAPSMNPTSLDDLALPWASQGFAVIATDYAGLGNEGVQGYTDDHDQAHSLLDSARALRALLDPSVLDDRVLLVGYSQGGGAVLASQGLASTYGAGGQVVAAVVFAAEYFARADSFTYETLLEEPTALTVTTGISMPVVAAMRDYAFAYNVLGASSAAVTFPQEEQAGIQDAIMSMDETDFGAYLQGVATSVGDLFDADFRTSLVACMQNASGCSGTGSQFYSWMENDLRGPGSGRSARSLRSRPLRRHHAAAARGGVQHRGARRSGRCRAGLHGRARGAHDRRPPQRGVRRAMERTSALGRRAPDMLGGRNARLSAMTREASEP